MDIKTRFKPGDRVYITCRTDVNSKCEFCGGTGRVQVTLTGKKGQTVVGDYQCPKGNCYRGLTTLESEYNVDPQVTVEEVRAVGGIGENDVVEIGIAYTLAEFDTLGGDTRKEGNVFATAEEAQAWCDKENKGYKDV